MKIRKELDKAIRFIEAGLKTKLFLEDIASEANMSAWHFHRVFLASTGITVGEYIRKRRMSEAARELVFTTKPIKQIASEYQYESQAAFTRSFNGIYGLNPGKLRRQVGPMKSYRALCLSQKGEIMLKPVMRRKETFRVVGISCQNTMKSNNIPALWNDFHERVCGTVEQSLNPNVALGICFYTDMTEITDDTPFTYLAGVEYPLDGELPEGMESRVVPGTEYAVFEHHGALDTLSDTYNAIYGEWLPQSEYERSSSDDFELYGPEFNYGAEDSVMEIWVPVQKKN